MSGTCELCGGDRVVYLDRAGRLASRLEVATLGFSERVRRGLVRKRPCPSCAVVQRVKGKHGNLGAGGRTT